MKTALVQDWLTGMRGGEKVLEEICRIFPEAPLYTMVHIPGSVSGIIEERSIRSSLLQRLPLGVRYYRYYLPLMPLLVKTLDTGGYDLVISTSHCVAKNVRAKKGGMHICYCHTPMRYIWDMFSHYFSPGKSPVLYGLMRGVRPWLRYADRRASRNVDYFIANSRTTAERISRLYGRGSEVIYPPVDTGYYTPPDEETREDFYLIVSSLVPYKRIDTAVEAFNRNGRRLKVIGSGPEGEKLRKKASGKIEFYDWAPAEVLRDNYRRCRALLFPGKEDFGIVPVEAMSCGAPVIAFGEGGATESVINGETGLYFYRQSPSALNGAVEEFEGMGLSPEAARGRAENFSSEVFRKNFRRFLSEKAGFL